MLTEPAMAARDRKRHHYPIAYPQFPGLWPNLNHLAHELMADDVPRLHGRDISVVEVQVRTADGRRRDLDDRIVWIDDLRVGHLFHPHVGNTLPANGFHGSAFSRPGHRPAWRIAGREGLFGSALHLILCVRTVARCRAFSTVAGGR